MFTVTIQRICLPVDPERSSLGLQLQEKFHTNLTRRSGRRGLKTNSGETCPVYLWHTTHRTIWRAVFGKGRSQRVVMWPASRRCHSQQRQERPTNFAQCECWQWWPAVVDTQIVWKLCCSSLPQTVYPLPARPRPASKLTVRISSSLVRSRQKPSPGFWVKSVDEVGIHWVGVPVGRDRFGEKDPFMCVCLSLVNKGRFRTFIYPAFFAQWGHAWLNVGPPVRLYWLRPRRDSLTLWQRLLSRVD